MKKIYESALSTVMLNVNLFDYVYKLYDSNYKNMHTSVDKRNFFNEIFEVILMWMCG